MAGVKYDKGKPRMELLPSELLTETAKILTFGAEKYEERNWEEGMDWGRVYGSLQRHLWKWWSGQDKDEESGESHLAHAACNIAFLLAYENRGVGKDTRKAEDEQGSKESYSDCMLKCCADCADKCSSSKGAF